MRCSVLATLPGKGQTPRDEDEWSIVRGLVDPAIRRGRIPTVIGKYPPAPLEFGATLVTEKIYLEHRGLPSQGMPRD